MTTKLIVPQYRIECALILKLLRVALLDDFIHH